MPSSILTPNYQRVKPLESSTDIRTDRLTHEIDHLQNFYWQFYKYGQLPVNADSIQLEYRINNKYTFQGNKIDKNNEIISHI